MQVFEKRRCVSSSELPKRKKQEETMRIAAMRRLISVPVAAMLVVSLAVPSPLSAQKVKQTAQGKQFQMKYGGGTEPVKKGTKMKVTVGKERIVCETGKMAPFSIPVADVVEVSYNTKSRRRLAESAGVALVFFPVAPVLLFMKSKKHFVNIVWEENGTGKEVVFKVGKGEYTFFLAELERVTGNGWKNLEMEEKQLQAERKQEQQELKRAKSRGTSVELDRLVRVGEAELSPGLYQIVVVEGEENKGKLYFFAGKEVDTKKIAAVALVEIVKEANDVADAEVSYKEEDGITRISEILEPARTCRFL